MLAKINYKEQIAKDIILVEFALQESSISFQPGQYFFISLIDPPFYDAKGATRHFSIVNSPNKKEMLTLATHITDSAFKRSLVVLPVGTEVNIGMIGGKFTLTEKTDQKLCFIALDIGITPYMSMLKYIEETNLVYKLTLIYSNISRESTPFLKELEEYFNQYKDLNLIITLSGDPGWTGERSQIDTKLLNQKLGKLDEYIFFIAGPPKLVDSINELLVASNINKQNIKLERFTGY